MAVSRRLVFVSVFIASVIAALRDATGETVTYTYDELGRLKTVTYSNGQTITYTYDAAGNRTVLQQTAVGAPSGSFSASPVSIIQGNASTLSWTSANATSASIDNGVGAVSPVAGGSVNVSPATTTTYTLTLTGPGGQTTYQTTVTVTPPAPTGSFSASPVTIAQGGSSTLSWTSANATSASIDNGVGAVTPVAGGSVLVSPSATTTYTLTLTGPGGQTTYQTTVSVNPPPSGSFSASPGTIVQGNSSTLSWTSANATSASIDNGVGAVTPVAGGSVNVSPSATTTYTLTLSGPGGTTPYQTTVTVTPAAFNATLAIPAGSSGANLRAIADAAGYSGAQGANVTFQLAGSSTLTGTAGVPGALNGGFGIDTGTWPTGSYTINLIVEISGKAYGGGGGGGNGAVAPDGFAGGTGGDAVYCRLPISITVNSGGELKAGGGGGGGGGGRTSAGYDRVGGGGGGGFPNGAGGAHGSPVFDGDSGSASGGNAGTISGGGAGGAGEPGGGGVGGNGGGAAETAGLAGVGSGPGTSKARGAQGVGGYAVRKNGHTVNVTNNGTIVGTQG